MADPSRLRAALSGTEAVIHTAGVNRAPQDNAFAENVSLAQQLTSALDRLDARPAVVFSNSIHAGNSSAFGQSKQAATELLSGWGRKVGAPVADVRLPNLFGEHGRPRYNSVVATFCSLLANGGQPRIIEDRTIPLLHVQDAVDLMLDLADKRATGEFQPGGSPTVVSALLEKLTEFRDLYVAGQIPDIGSRVDRALFNTYRSYCFPDHYPIYPFVRSDRRGDLFEAFQSRGGRSLVFTSTSHPGVTRGDHFHLRKVERFLVMRGTGTISLRRLFGEDVVRFNVSGDTPAIVDMPTMWAHSITNTGSTELLTMFWADELLDPEQPDTYPEPVDRGDGP